MASVAALLVVSFSYFQGSVAQMRGNETPHFKVGKHIKCSVNQGFHLFFVQQKDGQRFRKFIRSQ